MNAFAVVDPKGNVVLAEIGGIPQFAVYQSNADAASSMVEWADEGVDLTGYKVASVTIAVSDVPPPPIA